MNEITPFRGYRFDAVAAGDLNMTVAPPWDVITDARQKELEESGPFNIIHLMARDRDPETVRKLFESWRHNGVVRREASPGFYPVRHAFEWRGETCERTGFFALVRLKDFAEGAIIPHEVIFEKYRDNRYLLTAACRANFEPVFMLYRDPSGVVEKELARVERPLFSGTMGRDTFSLGIADDPETAKKVTDFFAGEKLFIADGHHRYQAGLRFFKEHPADVNSRILVYLVNLSSPGLMILPTHRYVATARNNESTETALRKVFDVTPAGSADDLFSLMAAGTSHCFGVYDGVRYLLLTLKREEEVFRSIGGSDSRNLKLLDVVILHRFIFPGIFGLGEEKFFFDADPDHLIRTRDAEGKGIVFFLNPVRKEEFTAITLQREIMPQKSTYFYPKVPSGLLIHRFSE